jgi:hypothetical protein
MEFENALKLMKEGKRVTNSNWNGKDQYVFMMPGYTDGIPANEALSNSAKIPEGQMVKIPPYLMLRNAQGEFVNWVPSTGDLFSKDWKVLPEIKDDLPWLIALLPLPTCPKRACKIYYFM